MPDGGPDPNIIEKTYTIDVITPLFGGGYEAGKVDPDMPIRASSIRGHLRFWWRATRGAKFDTVEELRQREGEIWGSMENPSPVGIEVSDIQMGEKGSCAYYRWRQRYNGMWRWALEWANEFDVANRSLPYVLFPFQGKMPDWDDEDKRDRPQTEAYLSGQFTLIVKYPRAEKMAVYRSVYNEQRKKKNINLLSSKGDDDAIDDDVTTAIRAWVNFGGIGARTRRGCGAIYCKDLAPKWQDKIGNWYLSNFTTEKINPAIKRRWPVLPGSILINLNPDLAKSIQSWAAAINVMKEFRQGRTGRNYHGNRPTRSRWPEAESLRNLYVLREFLTTRPPQFHPPDPAMHSIAFPRVEFGMPIILEIRNEGIKPTLQPDKTHDRMASPLILRPLKTADGKYSSMIVKLDTPPLESAYIKPTMPCDVEYSVSSGEIRDLSYTVAPPVALGGYRYPMEGRCTTGSALDAFISFVQEPGNGFRKVP